METATRSRPGSRAAASTNPPPPAAASQEERRVRDPPRQRSDHAQAVPHLALGPERDAVALGLEPEQAAERGGNADRAAAVGAQGGADHAAATAAPAPPLEPPGVWSSDQGLRVAPKASDSVNGKIVSSGTCVLPMTMAPASRRARTTSASRSRGPAVRQRAPGRDLPGDVGVVLDRHRDAEQRAPIAGAAAPVGLVGLHQGAVGEHDAEGVDLGIRLPDALERRLDELARGDLAGGHEARLLGGAGVAEVGGVHGAGEH